VCEQPNAGGGSCFLWQLVMLVEGFLCMLGEGFFMYVGEGFGTTFCFSLYFAILRIIF